MNEKDAAILALAVWRLSHMAAWEDGVFGLNHYIRNHWAEVEYGYKHSNEFVNEANEFVKYQCELPPSMQPTFITTGIKCVYCLSFWFSLLAYAAYAVNRKWTICVATPLALNALAIWANKAITE